MRATIMMVSLLLTSGCASTYREDARQLNTNYLQETTVIANLTERHLDAQYVQQNVQVVGAGAIGGLIGGLVNAGMNAYSASNAEDTVEKLRSSLGPKALENAYEGQYQLLITHFPDLQTRPVKIWLEEPSKGLRGSGVPKGEIGLLLSPQYSLTVSKRRLHVELEAQLFKMPEDSKMRPEILYKNRFIYQSSPIEAANRFRSAEEIAALKAELEAKYKPLPKDDYNRIKEKNKRAKKLAALEKPLPDQEYQMRQAALWLKDDAVNLRNYFREGVVEIFAMFAHDFANVDTKEKFVPAKPQKRGGNRVWSNIPEGHLSGTWVSIIESEALETALPNSQMLHVAPAI